MLHQTCQVLVVEDNPDDIYIIQEAFKDCGYPHELTFAASHEEGLQILAAKSLDLVLSDFGTIIEKARAFIQSTRTIAPRLPIIILSGTSDPNVAYDAGANAFVKKAVSLAEFFEKIKGIMRFWLDVAELPQPFLHHPAVKSSDGALAHAEWSD